MKNKIVRFTALVGVIAFASLFWACSDGAAPDVPEAPAPEAPKVVAQAVVPAGTADQNVSLDTSTGATNMSMTVTSGAGLEVRWNIKGVISAEMSATPDILGGVVKLDIDATAKEASGSKFIPALTSDVTITITAVNKDDTTSEDAPSTEVKVTIQIGVTPEVETLTVGKFEAAPEQIKAGGTSKLSWEVAPSDAKVSIADDAGNYLVPATTTAEDSGDLEASGSAKALDDDGSAQVADAAAAFAAVGSVDVAPTKDTTYTLTATTADGQTATKTVTVTIAPVEFKIVSFTANGQEGNFLMEKAGEARLSWEVTPSDAIVTIDQSVGQVAVKDSATVNVEKTTTYTLTASLGDKIESKQVTVTIQEAVRGEQYTATLAASSTDVFSGEDVILSWEIKGTDGKALPADAVVTLNGERVDGSSVSVRPTESNDYSIEVVTSGGTVKSNEIEINVRSWNALQSGNQWNAVGVVDNNLTVVGALNNSPKAINFGKVSSNNFEKIVFDGFANEIATSYFKGYPADNVSGYGTMPVNAIVAAGSRIYAAGTGALLYSDDRGGSWAVADLFPMVNYDVGGTNKYLEHDSCKGTKQRGDETGDKTLANYQQICDVLVSDNRVILAVDRGVFYKDNVDETLIGVPAEKRTCWMGIGGKNKCSTPNALSQTVVNALKAYGGSIYAATAKGVWISSDNATTWIEFNGGALGNANAVYDIEIDVPHKKLYAAGPEGVYSADLSMDAAPTWVKASETGAIVYSLAVDSADRGMIYAGTEKGIFISRDFGGTWLDVSSSMGASSAIMSLAVSSGSGQQAYIYAATGSGVFSAPGSKPVALTVQPVQTVTPSSTQSVEATATAQPSIQNVMQNLF